MNIKNVSGAPRKTCERPCCKKKIPLYTALGALKAPHRLKGQKYCSAACARLHYFEEQAVTDEDIQRGKDAMNKFIYPPELRCLHHARNNAA